MKRRPRAEQVQLRNESLLGRALREAGAVDAARGRAPAGAADREQSRAAGSLVAGKRHSRADSPLPGELPLPAASGSGREARLSLRERLDGRPRRAPAMGRARRRRQILTH